MSTFDVDMPFLHHLAELRNRISVMLIGALVAAVVCYYWATELFHFLTAPLAAASENIDFIGTGPAEAFIVKMKVAVAAGVILSSPISFHQLWKFISPGLLESERKFALPFVFFSSAFFLSGVSFCFYLVLPMAFQFFDAEYVSIGVKPQIKIGEYLGFVLKLMIVFGGVFELPILSYFLARTGILTHQWLLKHVRVAVVVIFIAAAIFTPPDVISQLLLALPLLAIYGLSILICIYFGKPRAESATTDQNTTV